MLNSWSPIFFPHANGWHEPMWHWAQLPTVSSRSVKLGEILERQRRYEAISKDTLESAYLSVDVLKLKTELDRASGPIS